MANATKNTGSKKTKKNTANKATNRKQPQNKAVKNNKQEALKDVNTRGQNKKISFVWAGIITLFVGILLGILIYSPEESIGIIGMPVKMCFLGLMSTSAFLLPVVVIALGIYTFVVKRTNHLISKIILSVVELILIGGLITLFCKWESKESASMWSYISTLWGYGLDRTGGGLIGGTIAIVLLTLIGKPASIVIILMAFSVVFCKIFSFSFADVVNFFKREEVEEEEEETEQITIPQTSIVDYINKKNEGKKQNEKPKKEESEIDLGYLEEIASQLPQTEGVKEIIEEQKKKKAEKPKKVEATTDEEKEEVKNEIEKGIEKPYANYKFPPIDILNKISVNSQDKRKEMYETANKLMQVLKDFGVDAKLLQVTQGPTVTRYEIQPSTGIKLSKITNLSEDIALNLAVPTVLVAAVPGKAAVGIEIPNSTNGTVSVRELIESDAFKNSKSKLSVAFGKDIGGNVVIGDISKFPHVLIAGATGSGKSVCLNTIIASILYNAKPDEVKLIMVDPKVVELGVYNGIPHLLIPVVTDPKKAAGALNWAVGEMMRRYALFAETGTRNIKGYNEHIEKENGETMPQIVIIIDELADLMMVAAKEVEDYICRLAQLARAAGIYLIIATQRPSVDVITGLIKANVPSRIAFAVSSGTDSRTILDKIGAEKLLGKGDMLYHPTGMANPIRVQGAFISDEEIEKVVAFVKENTEESSYANDLAEHIERIASGENGVTDQDESEDADELLPQAIEIAAELGQISTAMIQRKMKVGYARAGRIIDQMETRGLISGPNGSKPRDVFLNRIRGLQEDGFIEEEETEEQETEIQVEDEE